MGDGDDPPDKENTRMDTHQAIPSITKISDGRIQVNVEGNSSDSDRGPPVKRRNSIAKSGKRSRSSSRAGKQSRSSSSSRVNTSVTPSHELNGLVNDNILSRVDPTSLFCPRCDEQASPDVVIRCSSCNGVFHASCKSDKKDVMPSKTWIVNFVKYIAGNNNGDYIGGRFSWNCASCLNVEFTADCKNLPDRLSRLEAIYIKSTAARDSQIQALTDAVWMDG